MMTTTTNEQPVYPAHANSQQKKKNIHSLITHCLFSLPNFLHMVHSIRLVGPTAFFGGRSMVSGALGKISRLCHLCDGPSNDSFQLLCSPFFGAPPLVPWAAAPVAYPSIQHCFFAQPYSGFSSVYL